MAKASRDHGPSDKLVDPAQIPKIVADQVQEPAQVAQENLADAQPRPVRVTGDGLAHDLTAGPPGEDHLADGTVLAPAQVVTAEDEARASGLDVEALKAAHEAEHGDDDLAPDDDTAEQPAIPSDRDSKADWEDALLELGVSAEWVYAEGRTKAQLIEVGHGLRDGEIELAGDGMPPDDNGFVPPFDSDV